MTFEGKSELVPEIAGNFRFQEDAEHSHSWPVYPNNKDRLRGASQKRVLELSAFFKDRGDWAMLDPWSNSLAGSHLSPRKVFKENWQICKHGEKCSCPVSGKNCAANRKREDEWEAFKQRYKSPPVKQRAALESKKRKGKPLDSGMFDDWHSGGKCQKLSNDDSGQAEPQEERL